MYAGLRRSDCTGFKTWTPTWIGQLKSILYLTEAGLDSILAMLKI